MHFTTTTTIALATVLHAGLSRAQIPLYKSFIGKQFTDEFCESAEFSWVRPALMQTDFFTDPDPANGVVKYVEALLGLYSN